MKVADLNKGELYRVSRSAQPQLRREHSHLDIKIDPPMNMLWIRWRRPPGQRVRKPLLGMAYPINPTMLYLGPRRTENMLWGMKKFHWFLLNGKQVGMDGHDVKFLECV